MPDFLHSSRAGRSDTNASEKPDISVGLVVGGMPAGAADGPHCGVRDYAIVLASALRDAGVDARVLAPASWGPRDGLRFVRDLRSQKLDVIHLQYPSIGHRYSLLPHLMGPLARLSGAARRVVVTLHEHSALSRSQRAASAMFRATADRLVFTTEYEARAYGAGANAAVIPIGSNVPVHPGRPARDDTVLYFGQIRPEKGIEVFLALARLSAAAQAPWRFKIIGSVPPRWRDYARHLRAMAPADLCWVEDAPFSDVAEAMASATAAFLPFPDGAGLRRGSLLAALSNGLPVIAPFGASTTDELRAVLIEAETAEAALARLGELRAGLGLGGRCGDVGRALGQRYGWGAITEQHLRTYSGVLAQDSKIATSASIDEDAATIAEDDSVGAGVPTSEHRQQTHIRHSRTAYR